MAEKKRIFLIERRAITREGLRSLINTQSDLMVCGEGFCCQESLTRLGEIKPDLVVVEVLCTTGFRKDVLAKCHREHPALPVLVLSTGDESTYAERCLRAGACGYLSKDCSNNEILDGIRQVLRGEVCVSKTVADGVLRRLTLAKDVPTPAAMPIDEFSDRELEIFRLIGEGQTTGQIAKSLGRSVSTVETYRARLKEKLGLKAGTELVRCAVCWVEGTNPTMTT